MYRYVLPSAIEHLRPKSRFCAAFVHVAKRSAHQLRLSHFVFGERDRSEEGSHVRRTWRAWLTLKKANTFELEQESEGMASATSHEVIFRRDGSFGRVPAVDNVRIVPGRKMVIPVNDDGSPVDEQGAEVIRAQQHEIETTRKNDEYEVVYLPPAWKIRVGLFIYSLWFIGMTAGTTMVVVPRPSASPRLCFARKVTNEIR